MAALPLAMIARARDARILRETAAALRAARPPRGGRADHPATIRIEAVNTRLAELGEPAPDLEKSSFRLARLATGHLTEAEAARGERLAREGEEPWRPLFRREAVLALRRLAQEVGGTVSRQHDGATLKTLSVTVFAIASEVGGQVVCVPHAAPGAARRVPTHTTDLDALADVRDFAARLQRLGLIEAPGERPSPTASATAAAPEKPTPESLSPAYTGIGARATPPAASADLPPWQMTRHEFERRNIRHGGVMAVPLAFSRAFGAAPEALPLPGDTGRFGVAPPLFGDSSVRYMLQDGSIWQYRGIGATPVNNAGRVRGWEDVTREVLQSHRHREAVVTALDAGLPVPVPVLVDYPDLASGRLASTADGGRGRLGGVGDGQVFLDDGTPATALSLAVARAPVTVLVITVTFRDKRRSFSSAMWRCRCGYRARVR